MGKVRFTGALAVWWIAGLCWAQAVSPPAPKNLAQELKALHESVEALKNTLQAQQREIETLKQQNDAAHAQAPALPPAQPTPQVPPPPPPETAAAPAADKGKVTQSTTPEIGALVDVLGYITRDKTDEEGNNKLSVRELELILGQDVDPFTRFDATITFSDFEDVGIEEAYITYLGLPEEIALRVGRLRPRIGKASSVHRDQLDTADDPLVVQEYLGKEGLSRTGLELSRFLPQFSKPLTQELTLGVMEGGVGDGGHLFGDKRRIPSYYLHLKNFWEISETANFELGATYLRGSSGNGSDGDVNALGVDTTFTYFVTPRNKLKLQSELYCQSRNDRVLFTEYHLTLPSDNEDPWGFYSLVDYRLSPRFGIGARYDWVEPVNNSPFSPRGEDTAYTGYLTFYQSEFVRLRLQYQYAELADGQDDNRLFLQGTFAVGVHKHQLK
jgi:hypothetical protein